MNEQTIITLIIVGSFLLVCALLLAALLIRRTLIATIEGFSWFRKVLLEHYIWVQDSSYYSFPSGSRNGQRKVEYYQSYEVIRYQTTTTTVNGNTTTTTQPVYGYISRRRTKYTYEIQKWIKSRELVAEGKERVTLHWPIFTLDHSTQERVKDTQAKYLVFFRTTKDKVYKRALPETAWTTLDDTCSYTLKINLFGQVKHIIPGAKRSAVMSEQTP